jgi:histidinol-phosphate aminotransferase
MSNGVSDKLYRKNILSISPYVPGKPIEEVKREYGIDDIIKLASNENPFGPSHKAISAMQKALESVHLYPDGNCYELRNALSKVLSINGDYLLFGNGSDELIKMIAETFLNKDEEVIHAVPSFAEYDFATKVMAGTCIAVPMKDYTHNLEAMKEAITENTKLVFICNPNNPTGTIVCKDEVDDFMKAVPQDIIVVFDQAYLEYATNSDYPDCLQYVRDGRNVILLRTFSKVYGLAGLRIGYAIARPELISLISRVKEPFNVNSLAQVGAIEALADQEHVRRCVESNNEQKKWLVRQFEELELNYIPTETNFIMIDTAVDSRMCFTELLKQGVIVRTGDIFDMPTWLRITIGTEDENQRLIKALRLVLGR